MASKSKVLGEDKDAAKAVTLAKKPLSLVGFTNLPNPKAPWLAANPAGSGKYKIQITTTYADPKKWDAVMKVEIIAPNGAKTTLAADANFGKNMLAKKNQIKAENLEEGLKKCGLM